MVLLTSSAISAAISGGVVCLFTFLLFLSGYVLQQQSVRSLQAALQEPIEVRIRVQPTLPPPLQNIDNDVLLGLEDENDTSSAFIETVSDQDLVQIAIGNGPSIEPSSPPEASQEPSPQQLWHAHVDGSFTDPASDEQSTTAQTPASQDDLFEARFAYVLSLPSPSDVCSVLLFTKWHRQFSQLPSRQVDILYIYPSDWETSSYTSHRDALRLLLESEHKHSAILHPVPVTKLWAGIDVESQLLSELARNPWPYDRVMYLRTPGMLLDTSRLDSTLTSSYIDRTLLKSSWTRLRAPVRRGGATALHPEVLLFAQGHGLMNPTGELQRILTAKAKTSHENNHHDEVRDEFLAKEAAYVLFNEKELAHRKKEKLNHNGIFERFERERELVCEGTNLIA